jgi:CheY-like chemotaxis protein/anti-sigma regulatory factor (Ser/Thr protein kinase)
MTDYGDESVVVDGDPARLAQVFGNLLANAAKYSPDRAVIEVSMERQQDEVIVRVRDAGIGIDAQTLPHVFDLFAQADRSLDRSDGGLGVGLTIVKALVDLHGGRVEAHSDGMGSGSTFTVRLPLAADAQPTPASTPRSAKASAPRHVLIVDDNRDAAESLAFLLQMAGHEAKTAYDGASALELLEHFRAQVILLDIGLPGVDGYIVAQSIRERFPDRPCRLYALTGYGREQDRALALISGFDDHLIKPIDPPRLLELIERGAPETRAAEPEPPL